MNLKKLAEVIDQAARESDPETADRVVLAFVSQSAGIYLYRVGHGFAQLGGDDKRTVSDEADELIATLWPEAPPKTKQYITILAHAAGKLGLTKLIGGGGDQ